MSRFQYLFKHYYSHTATWEEQQEFLRLLKSGEHDETLKALLDELLTEEVEDQENWMPDDAASNMLRNIMQTTAEQTPKRRYLGWYISAAASLLLFTWWLINNHTTAPAPQVVAAAHTDTMTNARLVLGNGEVVDLEKKGNDSIQVQRGLTASKNGNLLAYASNENLEPTNNTVYTNKGGTYKIVLPDGTNVTLNTASSLKFPTAFTSNTREVTVNGEAYFDVAADAEHPFIVNTPRGKITVLGTRFNIKAYEEEDKENTTLLQGAVNVNTGTYNKQLQPGQQAQISKTSELTIRKTDTNIAIAWTLGRFEFEDNIQVIMRELARWYDVSVRYEGAVLDRSFNAAFSRSESLEGILQQLQETGSIHFTIKDKTVIVSP